jgi:RNA polymerase sigma factor (sigma-70 family)
MSNSSDRTALEYVLAEAKWLRGLALCLARDQAEAEDLVQETWMAAMRASPEPRASLRPWLAQVLRNVRRQGLRGSSRRRARETGAALLQEGEVAACTESLLARLELQRLVSEMVRDLDEPYRTTLLLRFFEDREPTEIARALGVPAGTVRWRLSEGLRRLRARLDEAHGGNRETWRAIVLAPVAGGSAPVEARPPATAGGGFSLPKVAWVAAGTLVPAMVAGLLIGRPERNHELATNAAAADGQKEVQREETNDMSNSKNRINTLFGLVLPALVASTDATAAHPSASGQNAPPACVPANNAARCIERIPRSQLPPAVDAALERIIAGRKVDKLTIEPGLHEGHKTYTVDFEVDGMDEEIDFAADGTFIESETDIANDDLPAVVARAMRAVLPDSELIKAEFHRSREVGFYELENGVPIGPLQHRPARTLYEVELRAPDGTRKLKISEDGRLLENKLKE